MLGGFYIRVNKNDVDDDHDDDDHDDDDDVRDDDRGGDDEESGGDDEESDQTGWWWRWILRTCAFDVGSRARCRLSERHSGCESSDCPH